MLHGAMRDFAALRQSAEAVIELDHEHPSGLWSSWARALRGWALAETGQKSLGIAELQRGAEQMRATGGLFLQPFVASLLARQFAETGQVEHGLAVLDQALANAGNGQSWCDAELHRVRGSLLLAQAVEDEAEAAYRRAIQIAQAQHAKLFELRATANMAQRGSTKGEGPKLATSWPGPTAGSPKVLTCRTSGRRGRCWTMSAERTLVRSLTAGSSRSFPLSRLAERDGSRCRRCTARPTGPERRRTALAGGPWWPFSRRRRSPRCPFQPPSG